MLTAGHIQILKRIKQYVDKRAGVDFGGRGHNRADRRLVNDMLRDGLLISSGNPPDRCIVGLTDAGRAALIPGQQAKL